MTKAVGPFRDSWAHSWFPGHRTNVPAEPPLIRPDYDISSLEIEKCEKLTIESGKIS